MVPVSISHRRISLLAPALAAAVAFGCDGNHDTATADAGTRAVWVDAHAVAGTRLALADAQDDALSLFDVAHARAHGVPSQRVGLPANPNALWSREGDHDDVLVASGGLRGVDEPPRLVAVSAHGYARRFALALPYTALAQSPDGRYAVAHFTVGAQDGASPASQIAAIDLDAREDGVTEIDFARDGSAPHALWLPDALMLEHGAAHFALASFDRALGVVSLEHPTSAPTFIVISGDKSLGARPAHVVALPEQAQLACLADGIDDVFVISVRSEAGADAFDVAQFPAGSAPSDLARVEVDGEPRLFVLADAGRVLHVLVATTGDDVKLDLDAPAAQITACPGACAYALLSAPGASRVTLVDVTLAGEADPRALRALDLPASVLRVETAGSERYAYAELDGGALAWIDLEEGRVIPVGVDRGAASDTQLAGDGSLWIAPRGQYVVTRFDPRARTLVDVLLHAPIAGLALVEDAERAVVIHTQDDLGLSVIDLAHPTFEHTIYVSGLP